MIISIITLFPEVFKPLLGSSILAKAQEEKKLKVNLINLRDFGLGPHRQVDDRIYGGGVGMILRVEPISTAIKKTKGRDWEIARFAFGKIKNQKSKTILLTPQGKIFTQKIARGLVKEKQLILVCGKYEGVDERVRNLVDEEISVGDYILSGGEIPAMVILDTITRLIPGVLAKEAIESESLSPSNLLEAPQYTRPEEFKGMRVPKILLSGNHQKISEWRAREALKKTRKRRPDLL